MKKIFIITSEASADLIGSKLLSVFLKHKENIQFYGVGGEHLSKCSNFTKLFDIKSFSVMGFIEIFKNIRTLKRNIADIKNAILKVKPDMIITVDGSSLAKHIVKWIKSKHDLDFICPQCIHYVAPQVWAWGEKRSKIFAKLFDKILCFFDFEPKYFLKYQYKVKCPVIGYTPIEDLHGNKKQFFKKYPEASDKLIITILPGSRKNEIKNIMEIYKKVAQQIYLHKKNVIFFLPVVSFLKNYVKDIISNWDKEYKPYIIDSDNDKYNLFNVTYLALSTSGTVVSELSFFNVPTIVSYKFNKLTALLAKIFVKIKFVSLINIINNKMNQIELLQKHANSKMIFDRVIEILDNKEKYESLREEIKKGMSKFYIKKYNKKPSEIAYKEIILSLFSHYQS